MVVLSLILWFGAPIVLAAAYVWGSSRLPMRIWAGVLAPLNIVAIIVIALPVLESAAADRRAVNAAAALLAAAALQLPATVCWFGMRWLRRRARLGGAASPDLPNTRPMLPADAGHVARLRRMRELRERASATARIAAVRRRAPHLRS